MAWGREPHFRGSEGCSPRGPAVTVACQSGPGRSAARSERRMDKARLWDKCWARCKGSSPDTRGIR
eukprot:3834544-Karenia_brevis.AAC.1